MSTAARLDRLAERPGSFPGALLLAGPSAGAVDAEARRLAARLLCPGDDPERSCESCRRVATGAHPDLLVVEPDGVAIKVDRVRQALVFAAGRPYEAARRVALVLRAEKLGVESANTLLKALEEPGSYVRWILTTERPESLLATIRSRCATALVAAPSRAERAGVWRARGFSEDDAADLALFGIEEEDDDAGPAESLVRARAARERVVQALLSAVSGRGEAEAVLLADELSKSDRAAGGLLAEILADAALAAAGSPERMRHRAVGGPIAEIAKRRSSEALRNAAVAAADAPEDSRRGNRRLHFESVLLKLILATPAD